MSRARLTRRGEVVVLLATAIALALLLSSLRYRWVQAYGLAGAMVLGLGFTAAVAAYLGCRAYDLLVDGLRRLIDRRRQVLLDGPASRAPVSDRHTNPATALPRPSEPQASDPRHDVGGRAVRMHVHVSDEIPPDALARIHAVVADELADRRRRRA
jgi:hypothetical protein